MEIKMSALVNWRSVNSQKVGGWSEQFYAELSSLTAGLNLMTSYMRLRMACCGSTATCIGIRATSVANPGLSLSKDVAISGASGRVTDTPWQSISFSGHSATQNKRSIILRAVPDANIVGGEYQAGDLTDPVFYALNFIKDNGMAFRGKNLANILKNVTNVTGAGVVTLSADLSLSPGNEVEFYRTKDTDDNPVKGKFIVGPVTSARVFTLANWDASRAIIGGKLRKLEYALYPIVRIEGSGKVTRRAIGRSFANLHGRASARR